MLAGRKSVQAVELRQWIYWIIKWQSDASRWCTHIQWAARIARITHSLPPRLILIKAVRASPSRSLKLRRGAPANSSGGEQPRNFTCSASNDLPVRRRCFWLGKRRRHVLWKTGSRVSPGGRSVFCTRSRDWPILAVCLFLAHRNTLHALNLGSICRFRQCDRTFADFNLKKRKLVDLQDTNKNAC